jgi:pimeloyl-ACP methyl ester carboxylesterase
MEKKIKDYLVLLCLLCTCSQVLAQIDSNKTFIATDGIKIHYEVKGTGFPVVLVHGFIVTGDNWKKASLYQELQHAGYQVITMDLRGNGKSDKPHEASYYEQDAQARDIMGIISSLGLKSYHVLGYSRGSIITARLLVLDNRIKKAVLGGMGAEFTNPEWPRRILFYHALMGENVPELKGMVEYVQKSGLDQLALAYQQKEQPSTSAKNLSKIKKPVLVICGIEDRDNGSGTDLAKLIPGSIFKEVPGNHNSASGTKAFSDTVITFLKTP